LTNFKIDFISFLEVWGDGLILEGHDTNNALPCGRYHSNENIVDLANAGAFKTSLSNYMMASFQRKGLQFIHFDNLEFICQKVHSGYHSKSLTRSSAKSSYSTRLWSGGVANPPTLMIALDGNTQYFQPSNYPKYDI
jgi:hypothetical protein